MAFTYFFSQGYRKEIRSWRWVMQYYLTVLIVGAITIIALFYYLQILPPANTSIAAGQDGSTTQKMSKSFQQTFAKYGLELTIVPGEGREEGLAKLVGAKSPVNASFYIAGHIDAEEYPDIFSLGIVSRAPLWLFYRGDIVHADNPMQAFKNKKIAIGLPGTATNGMFRRLFGSAHFDIDQQFELKELSYRDAEKELVAGTIDAMFIIYAYNTDVVQNMIKHSGIHIFDFKLADAYIKKYPNLEKITIPRGAFDIESVKPNQDITLLSTSITLLAEKSLHPAVQWAFLFAARNYNRQEQHFFSRPGEFPKDADYDSLPLSPVAERYYATGTPQIFSNFSIWLATLIDEIWIKALAFYVLIYPILVKLFGLRAFALDKVKKDSFAYLRYLNTEGLQSTSIQEIETILIKIEDLNQKVAALWSSAHDAKDYIEFAHIAQEVKESLSLHLKQLSSERIA